MFVATQTTVDSTGEIIVPTAKVLTASNQDPVPVSLINSDTAHTVYLGGAGVTTATGFPLGPGAILNLTLTDVAQLYGICASSISVVVGALYGRQN